MIRARIIVKGKVQKVGYREIVEDAARKLDIKGYVKNLKDGNVEVICECDEGVLQDFCDRIKAKKDFIDAKEVEIVERSRATGEFEYFEIKYGKLEEEIGDRMATGVKYASATLKETRRGRQDIKDIHRDMNEKFDWMADKYGEFGKIMKSLDGKIDSMDKSIEKMENSFTKFVNHIIERDKG